MTIEDTYSPRKTNQRLFDPFREISRPLLLYSLQLCEARINVYYKIRCSTSCTGLVNRSPPRFTRTGLSCGFFPLPKPLLVILEFSSVLVATCFSPDRTKTFIVCLLVDVGRCSTDVEVIKRGEKPKFAKFLFFLSFVRSFH